ncbi:MAG: hypothetical protein FJ295_21450 [Planctomycetes bacterium]|nr:hypothetical protein [Planctomycetota bacterium]
MKIDWKHWVLSTAAALSACGCAGFKEHNLPPAQQLLEPGPGVGGPGPGVIPPASPAAYLHVAPAAAPSVQVLFNKPDGMEIRWDVSGIGQFDSSPLIVPGRNNFPQGGIYRIKLTNIPGRAGIELYPTIEVGPTTPRTEAFLAHNAIPLQFSEEDFDQALTGNFVTKVIYLPDPEFQELALGNVETLVSTRLDPGVDPIVEADRRGSIMIVIRLGNKDIEMAGANNDALRGAAQASFDASCSPYGYGAHGGPPGSLPNYVAGVTLPNYGMPMSGTPIGLAGPPHVPFGAPAGLQQHIIRNHTHVNLPKPTQKYKMHVRQIPGYSYPAPPSRMRYREQSIQPAQNYGQPRYMRTQQIHNGDDCPDCP